MMPAILDLSRSEPAGILLGAEAGRYEKRRGHRLAELEYWQRPPQDDGWIRRIIYRDSLSPAQAQNVVRHEIGHAVEDRAGSQVSYLPTTSGQRVPFGTFPEAGFKRELGQVYHDLNDPTWGRGQITPPRLQTKPEDFGYRGDDVRSERIAEAAYMADPNYLKTVAPKTAAAIREAVNSHPVLSRIIQFNTVAGPVAIIGADPDTASMPDRFTLEATP
jgi:hypothetical protein